MYDFLKRVTLFADLSTVDLEKLCQMAQEVSVPAGEQLFAEGSVGDKAYIIKDGQLEVVKQSGGREVLLAVRQQGEVIGEMSLLGDAPRMATVRARTNSSLITISSDQLDYLLSSSSSAARAMLYTAMARLRSTEALLRQSEKMAQIGTLTAGIAHELNNPAAAAARASAQLSDSITLLQQTSLELAGLNLSVSQRDHLSELAELMQEAAARPPMIDALAQSDLEEALESWLVDQGIENAWELTPTLVSFGYDSSKLEALDSVFEPPQLPAVIRWLDAMCKVYSLLMTVNQGAGRMSEIVKALKTYVYLDQGPMQTVDVHEGLDNTLIMLRSKMKSGVTVQRDYAPNLPRIEAYGSELNQVWTNLIDNAIDAMKGQGQIAIRSRVDGSWVIVEIEDNGPGIPAEIQPKIFDPFFTTKPPGQGTGLGLNISYNIVVQKHRGQITINSHPGKTTFQVKLPINPNAVVDGKTTAKGLERASDDKILEILRTTQNIAVVGISAREDRPSYAISAYLQAQGYHIFPVNPTIEQVLGEKAYPDLVQIQKPIDVVLIFRQAEAIPPIVEEAIKVGAKVIWMQEGIVHETAAQTARNAGLDVIMDTCMRAEHKRLVRKE